MRRPTCKTVHQQKPRSEYDDYDEADFTYCQRGRGEFWVLNELITTFDSRFLFVQHLCPIRCYEEKGHKILNHDALL